MDHILVYYCILILFIFVIFTYSIQSAFEAIQRSQQDNPINEHYDSGCFSYNNNAASNRHQRRRSSLPADPFLFKSLKRTPSHGRFPHLNPTKSIPFGFSPASAGLGNHSLLPSLRPSKSHCNFPHLPCSPVSRSSRRGSLPANFKLKDQRYVVFIINIIYYYRDKTRFLRSRE